MPPSTAGAYVVPDLDAIDVFDAPVLAKVLAPVFVGAVTVDAAMVELL